jgi:hypothetical protein
MPKVRIPSVALATLVLGCGDDGDKNDVSDARIERVAKATCEQAKACEAEFDEPVEDCTESYAEYFAAEINGYSTGCKDAILDYYECYAELSCDELDAADDEDEEGEDGSPCDEARIEKACANEQGED